MVPRPAATTEPRADDAPATTSPRESAGTPGATPTKTPTGDSSPTANASEDPGDQVGSGDAEGDDEPATKGGGVCGELTASEVGGVLGGTVKGSALPGGAGGCAFVQADAKAPAASVVDKAFQASGMDTAKAEATSAVEGTPQDLSGIGSEAFVVTGTVFGGADIQAAGAVQVGSRVVSVTVTQQKGISRTVMRAKVVAMLKLVAAEIS